MGGKGEERKIKVHKEMGGEAKKKPPCILLNCPE